MNCHPYNRWNQQSTSIFDPPCLSSSRQKAKMVDCHNSDQLKVDLRSVSFLFAFVRFFFSLKTRVFFVRIFIIIIISALTRQSHTGQKFSKNIFYEGVQLYFEILLFEQNFYLYVAVYSAKRICKNSEEKAHTFSGTSKNQNKTRRKIEYCVNSPKTLKIHFLRSICDSFLIQFA